MNNLVIVESPTKARTLERFLGSDYTVVASMGHIRDLPKSEFGVDIEHDFEPEYIIPRDKRKRVNELKKLAKEAKTLWLATDLDREGEAIAWHLEYLMNGNGGKDIKRVVFHEITEHAIKEAFRHPKDINLKLVNAQQARRILDRVVGYKLSPLLWQKVKRGLSAGRVQSVTLRIIVDREREITAFKPEEYWIIEAELSAAGTAFIATLIELNGKKLAIKNEEQAKEHIGNLEKASYTVSKITKREVRRFPYPPFTTSTLQQAGVNRFGYSPKKTMMLSQGLYERGLITYMRTDSVNLAPTAVSAAREYIGQNFGKNYIPPKPRFYKAKSKNVQEAHEAIRPTNVRLQATGIRQESGLNRDHVRLYDLIWKRFLACQMNEAVIDQTTVDVQADNYLLRATGSVIKFEGWLKLYGKVKESEELDDDKEKLLPKLSEGELLKLLQLLPGQHFTEPPPRYTESSLIKKLEELGIGRPSTYAPIIGTIQDRFYVERQERKFVPTPLGFAVTDFLVNNFSDIMDYKFTAGMEDELDEIANGRLEWVPTLKKFYLPFEKKLEETAREAEKIKVAVEYAGKKCPKCGKELILRTSRFGKFLACSGFPDCKHTESLEQPLNISCPDCGGEVVIRRTKRGKTFYGCKNWPGCKFASWTKPARPTGGPKNSPLTKS